MAKSRKAEIGKKVGLGFLETVIHVCVYILVILVFIRAATLSYDFSYHVFGNPAMSRYDQTVIDFQLEEGTTVSEIAKKLEDAGLVKYQFAFRIRARLSDLEDSFIPGIYELSPSMSADAILTALTTPTTVTAGAEAQVGEDASGEIETAAPAEEDSSGSGEE